MSPRARFQGEPNDVAAVLDSVVDSATWFSYPESMTAQKDVAVLKKHAGWIKQLFDLQLKG